MNLGTVALLGDVSIEPGVFGALAASFNWAVDRAETFARLRAMSTAQNVVAVLFDARNLGVSWNDALESVLAAAPRALPIVCTGFSELVHWPDLADAGAFCELRLPIDEGEARRCLGFIWAAKREDQIHPAAAPEHAPGMNWRKAAVKFAGNCKD
jgi:hypothetical protein